jgi:hypothetical protein
MMSCAPPTVVLMSVDWIGKITTQEGLTERLQAMGIQLMLHETQAQK